MNRPIIILNGPPNCGKDTLADALSDVAVKVEFKHALYKETAKYCKVDLSHFTNLATNRSTKEKYIHMLGCTPRGALIHVSENIIKPQYGKQFFGKALARTISQRPWASAFVVSDGGFDEEIEPLHDVGKVLIVRVLRDGCSFEGDSRKYLDNPICVLDNNGTVEEAVHILKGILNVYAACK